LLAASLFGVIALVISKVDWAVHRAPYEPTTAQLGNLFLTKYLLAFELISVLLLFAMVGAAILVRKEIGEEKP
jgi:NADH-quinone oxidoreductase subunit J